MRFVILFHICFHILLILWKIFYYSPGHISYKQVESDVHLQRHYRMGIVLLWVFWAWYTLYIYHRVLIISEIIKSHRHTEFHGTIWGMQWWNGMGMKYRTDIHSEIGITSVVNKPHCGKETAPVGRLSGVKARWNLRHWKGFLVWRREGIYTIRKAVKGGLGPSCVQRVSMSMIMMIFNDMGHWFFYHTPEIIPQLLVWSSFMCIFMRRIYYVGRSRLGPLVLQVSWTSRRHFTKRR